MKKKTTPRTKPIFSAKKLGKRRLKKKVVSDPNLRQKFIDACAATLAQNRDRYFDAFLSLWEQAAASLGAARDDLLARPDAPLTDARFNAFARAWDPFHLKLFMRLADRLTEQEERVFRLRAERLDTAWRSFAPALLARRPDLAGTVNDLCETAQLLDAHVAEIFLGERLPQLDAGYTALMHRYDALVRALFEEGETENERP